MSRVMEVVVDDPIEIAARRARKAFQRIGKIDEYHPATHMEGRIYCNGYPARVKINWKTHRDNKRVRLDIAATSYDELSRAADVAMYRFARTYKEIDPARLDKRDLSAPSTRTIFLFLLCLVVLFVVGSIVLGRQTGYLPLDTSGK